MEGLAEPRRSPDDSRNRKRKMRPETAGVRRSSGLIAAVAAIVLVVIMFALKWYGPGAITRTEHSAGSVNGWHGLLHLHWLMLAAIVAVLLALALHAAAGPAHRTPAADAAVSLICLATVLWLGYRVLISVPVGEKWPAYLGLACAVVMFLGAALALPLSLASMRRPHGGPPDPPPRDPSDQPAEHGTGPLGAGADPGS